MTSDRIAALVLLVVAVQYIGIARTYRGLTVVDVVGPSAYPILLGGLMALLAISLLLQSKPQRDDVRFWTRHRGPALLLLSLFGYMLLLERLGFVLTTLAYMILAHLALGERSWLRAITVGLAITGGLWIIFDRVLGLNLPPGLLRFLL